MSEENSAQAQSGLTEKQRRFRRLLAQGGREGAVIALIALCLYLTMALVSFNPADPGWSSIGHDLNVTNYAGRTGAWIASLLMDFFGKVAFLFPALVAVQVIHLIRQRRDAGGFHAPLAALRLGGFVLILLSGTSLLSLYAVMGLDADAGGVLGREVSDAMVSAFNLPAATLLLVAIFLFALTVFTGLSWFRVMDTLGAWTLRFLAWLKDAVRPKPKEVSDANQETPARQEPPIVNDRVVPAPPKKGRWSPLGWFRRRVRIRKARVEPQLEGATTESAEPARLAEGISAEPDADAPGQSEKDLRITPYSRDDAEPAPTEAPRKKKAKKPAARKKQPSLFDNVDSPLPSLDLLDPPDPDQKPGYSKESLQYMSELLEEKLGDFGVKVEVVEVNPGPVITRFEIKPAPGVKVSRITNLAKDLARSLAVISVRVVEVIPGKSVVGIEIPNEQREMVRLKEVLSSDAWIGSKSSLTMALGNDIGGNPMVANLSKMPHLLVAGTTGSGKSVGVNAMILSILLKSTPEEVRFIMVDPKMLELNIYDGIPHLLAPVVTDMKEAANGLRWCVAEMERRYKLMAALGVRNLAGFNRKVRDAAAAGEPIGDPLWKPEESLEGTEDARPELEALPHIVVVIDEFADMMMIVGKKVEELIARIAQKARAAGIHLILATQRPSVDVITGLIKANIPTRISFSVQSKVDSRTVLDQGGAEQLLGHGDMLYLPPGSGHPVRVHGAFVDDDEVHRIVEAWKQRGEPIYEDNVLSGAEGESLPGVPTLSDDGDNEQDALFDEAVYFVTEGRRVSISSVQRKFKIGYNRAANLVDAMEAAGVVSAAGHNGAREVLAPPPPKD
ncbi:DNA translocase FtsK [Tamilnaduibacter salinus]|uniref:DNA translocase FtsK n=1 Tax=Tamilnaduibacter salinus TaxID=1484056 RepID=A0A2U1CZL8_9GAMM|nr:DNA translocase FtsK [Tamilnaduibacter salinus]PVY78232.1 DNA translocase FtsK [Tamilnaduibacter salinus]